MNTQVTNQELTLILLVSVLTILIVLFIVGKWLNFHIFACCINRIRIMQPSTTVSAQEQPDPVEMSYKGKITIILMFVFHRDRWHPLSVLIQLMNR